jgi:hypothetical protein
MRRTGLALLAAAGALLLGGAAQAKAPPSGMDVCGPTACVHVAANEAEQFWIRAGEVGHATAAAPYYVLRWHFEAEPEQSAYFVPATGGLRWLDRNGWSTVSRAGVAALKQPLSRIEPYAAPAPTYVTVGRRVARQPETYLRLFDGTPSVLFPATSWLRVTLRSSEPSPWTNGSALIQLGKTVPYVVVDGWTFRIPRAVAKRARLGLSLRG